MGKARRTIIITIVLSSIALLYLAAPFWTAWQIHTAIKNNDTATLQAKIDWPSVRTSLRQSIVNHSDLLPTTSATNDFIQPTLWQRIRHVVGNNMLDHFMNRYITAEGLPLLYRGRRQARRLTRANANTHATLEKQTIFTLSRRLTHVQLKTLNKLEFGFSIRELHNRKLVVSLQRYGLEWKLSRLLIAPGSKHIKNNQITADDGRIKAGLNPDDEYHDPGIINQYEDEAEQHAGDFRHGRLSR